MYQNNFSFIQTSWRIIVLELNKLYWKIILSLYHNNFNNNKYLINIFKNKFMGTEK